MPLLFHVLQHKRRHRRVGHVFPKTEKVLVGLGNGRKAAVCGYLCGQKDEGGFNFTMETHTHHKARSVCAGRHLLRTVMSSARHCDREV